MGTDADVNLAARRAIFAGTAVSNAGGDAVFAFPAGLFSVAPVVESSVQSADSTSPLDYRITALTNTSCTVRCRSSPATVIALLGLTLLGASVVQAGVTVHLVATVAGSTP